jgi:protein O-GlcNAc transferase
MPCPRRNVQDGRDQSLYQAALREFNGGDRPAARRSCGELLVRHPGLAPLLHLMGLITNAEGQPREARALITTAIAAEPSVADYRNSLGVVLAGTDQFGPALTAFDAALGLRPAYAAAHRNRGHALERLGRPDESALAYRAALRLEPADFATWQSLLAVCHQCWDLAGAIECRRRTAELRPADAVLGSDLLYMLHYSPELTPRQMLAEHMEWAARFCNAGIAHEGELGDEKTEGRKRAEGADGSTDAGPVILNDVQRAGSLFHEGNGRIAHEGHEGARSEGGIKAGKCADGAAVSSAPVNEGQQAFPKERSGAAGSPPEPNTSSSLRVTSCSSWAVPANGSSAAQRRLRVGYVSPDFREHTPPRFLAGALMHHDPGAFEVFCYSDVREGDHVTAALQPMGPAGSWPDGPAWRETAGLDDAALEAMVRADRIDILVDLRGHGSGNRLKVFARRPAPVQVNMIGYFNTTGLPTMDWRITDERQDPFDCAQGRPAVGQAPGLLPRAQNHRRNAYATGTERLARLPGGCWCYVAGDAFGDPSPPVLPPPALRAG